MDCLHQWLPKKILGQGEKSRSAFGENGFVYYEILRENYSLSSQLNMLAIDGEHPGWQQSAKSTPDATNR